MRLRTVALGLLVAAAWPAATAQAADRFTIRGNAAKIQAVGPFAVSSDPSANAAIAVFGPPSSTKRSGDTACRLGWRTFGLRITFADFGGGSDPCGKDGKAQIVSAFGKAWNTSRGLKVGQTTKRLRKLYPGATRRGSTYTLLRAKALEGGGTFARASAATRRGKVTSLRIFVGAAGT